MASSLMLESLFCFEYRSRIAMLEIPSSHEVFTERGHSYEDLVLLLVALAKFESI